MSKLPECYQFVDLSDYGRFIARKIAHALKETAVSPIQVTAWFIVSGVLAIACILFGFNFAAAFFLVLKSILDAADGELSRLKETPSYVGRYFDSIADIILNFFILLAFWSLTDLLIIYMVIAFIAVQLQGTLYNYYYVILRNSVNGDLTSRIFEDSPPVAMAGEDQKVVDLFYGVFNLLYRYFDKVIYLLDRGAIHSKPFPRWFMTLVSTYGLGFQLLVMSILLVFNFEIFVIPFFIGYSVLIFVFVGIRKFVLDRV